MFREHVYQKVRNTAGEWCAFGGATILFLFVMALASAFGADDRKISTTVATSSQPEKQTNDWPPEYGPLVTVHVDPYTFKVPYKYFSSVLGGKDISKQLRLSSFGFAFWYPHLRPTQHRVFSKVDPRPKEIGNPEPSKSESIIYVQWVRYTPGLSEFFTPRQEYQGKFSERNPINIRDAERRVSYGLDEYISSRRNKIYFLFSDKFERYMKCTKNDRAIFKFCYLKTMILDEKIFIKIRFIGDQISKWREIESSAISLLERFRAKGADVRQ